MGTWIDYDAFSLLVDDSGMIVRGTAPDGFGRKTVYPYKRRNDGWWNVSGEVSLDDFTAGFLVGKYALM